MISQESENIPFLMCHSKNNPPAMQGEESSLDERTPMLE